LTDRLARSVTASAAALFADLVELEPAARERRLAGIEGSAPDLARTVRGMLAADAAALGPLERLREEVATAAGDRLLGAAAPPFPRVGAWRLLERLGAGGMGEVWAGEREDGGFAQRAAIKLVRTGFASEAVVARFELERQVLARLEHPAIARLLDGGLAPDGRPWFAMERVDGVPVTEFARAHELPLEARLRLMIEVCAAVDAAHRSLVVHRDLKPSNILVTAEGRPKLLDFGLAKLLEPELDPRLTRTEVRALTPAYAAPEQVLGEPVTTATDVYALGVVLYELVTARLPHRREASTGAALAREIERETLEGPATAVRRDRGGAPPWPHRLARDLDTLVLQALRREPARRYPSAAALGADLERLLDGRPISARADRLGYRAGKFVRRHRVAVGAAALVLLSLLGGLVAAIASARRAEREARRAVEVQEFLVGLFEAADPERSLGAEVTARQLLDAGVAELERGLTGEPEVQAALFDTVAQIERRIGRYDSAERLSRVALERRAASFGADSLATAEARLTLAEVLFSRGELEPAGEQFRAAHARLERARDARPEVLLRAGLGLAEAELYLGNNERALEISEGVLARAVAAWGEEHESTASALLLHGQLLEPAGRYAEAVVEIERATAILERTLGRDHPRTSEARLALAEFVGYLGDRPRAHRLFEETTGALRRTLGGRHALLAQALVKHALVWINDGRPEEAERTLEEALGIFSALGHFEAASCERLLGHTLLSRGKVAEAATRFASAYEQFRARLGEDHAYTLTALGNLGTARVRLGEHEEAVAMLARAIAGIERLEGLESDDLRQPLLSIGEAERARGDLESALAHHRRALAIAEARVGPRHAGAANARRELALDLAARGGAALAEALAEFERAIAIRRETDGASARLADWLEEAAGVAERAGDAARAGAWRAEAAAIRGRTSAGG
jgi:serine/threonine-protein kinase